MTKELLYTCNICREVISSQVVWKIGHGDKVHLCTSCKTGMEEVLEAERMEFVVSGCNTLHLRCLPLKRGEAAGFIDAVIAGAVLGGGVLAMDTSRRNRIVDGVIEQLYGVDG